MTTFLIIVSFSLGVILGKHLSHPIIVQQQIPQDELKPFVDNGRNPIGFYASSERRIHSNE